MTPPGWRCDIDAAPEGARQVLRDALACLGMHEQPPGSNRGPVVDKWNGMEGKPPGVKGPPWCAYFASACYRAAPGGSPFGKMGSTHDLGRWGVQHGRTVATPQPGDLGLVYHDDVHGHTTLIVAVLPDGRVATIEGNESDMVLARFRDPAKYAVIVRPLG